MTQWFGGLGVIALFVVVLPRLGIAGRQLFFAEASTAPSDAVSPQIRRSAGSLWKLYVALTVLCAICLACGGMSLYESLLHAMTTLSAGGFSPQANSIAAYSSSYIEWVLIGFMFLAGASFPLQLRAAMGKPLVFLKDDEFLFTSSQPSWEAFFWPPSWKDSKASTPYVPDFPVGQSYIVDRLCKCRLQ